MNTVEIFCLLALLALGSTIVTVIKRNFRKPDQITGFLDELSLVKLIRLSLYPLMFLGGATCSIHYLTDSHMHFNILGCLCIPTGIMVGTVCIMEVLFTIIETIQDHSRVTE